MFAGDSDAARTSPLTPVPLSNPYCCKHGGAASVPSTTTTFRGRLLINLVSGTDDVWGADNGRLSLILRTPDVISPFLNNQDATSI